MFRRRDPDPAPMPDLLGWLGAVPFGELGMPAKGECFVYGLDGAELNERYGHWCFYVGKSASLLTRLGAHQTAYGERITGIRVLRCQGEADMEVTELFLIERMQPVMNILGTETEKRRRRVATLQAPRPYDPAAAQARRWQAS